MSNINTIGKVCHRFDELASTNDYARELIAKGNPAHGTAIVADRQTAGRGQYGRSWVSEPGKALSVSFILFPQNMKADALHVLGQAVALGVADTVAHLVSQAQVRIKWPNDVYIGDRKTAGILIENSLSADGGIAHSIVGIGINVSQSKFPEELPNATSMAQNGSAATTEEVLSKLFVALSQRFQQAEDLDNALLSSEYQTKLYGLYRSFTFQVLDHTSAKFEAEILGIDSQNQLLLRQSDGFKSVWMHGQISMIG